jgi:hypothetical protein
MDDNPYQPPESEPLPEDSSGLGDPSGILDYVLYLVIISVMLGVSLFVALMVMCGGNSLPHQAS